MDCTVIWLYGCFEANVILWEEMCYPVICSPLAFYEFKMVLQLEENEALGSGYYESAWLFHLLLPIVNQKD